MSQTPREQDFEALGALAPRDMDARSAARILAAAHAELDAARGGPSAQLALGMQRAWSRALLPALLAIVCVVYLGFAFEAAAAIYR
jgi:hypothetical protein